MNNAFEEIKHEDVLLAIIIYNDYEKAGVKFFTDNDLSQQVAYMQHAAGKSIDAHIHKDVRREVTRTQEVLFIKEGKLRVDFYDDGKSYTESRILGPGDIILLISGGHGFYVIDDLRMIEVKQGPYSGDEDKEKFTGISSDKININGTKNNNG